MHVNVINPKGSVDCTYINFPVLILYHNHIRCYNWRKVDEGGHQIPLYYVCNFCESIIILN